MKKISFLVSLLLVACGSTKPIVSNIPTDNVATTNTVTTIDFVKEENVSKTLKFLTSDELEGRDTGSKGIEKASVYLENLLKENGVKYIQGLINQLEPREGDSWSYSKKYHYQGQKNSLGQRYLIRNAFFEPTINPRFDWESDCLKRIDLAFKFRKPAIVSSHRLNYMGYLNPKNRSENLLKLKSLFSLLSTPRINSTRTFIPKFCLRSKTDNNAVFISSFISFFSLVFITIFEHKIIVFPSLTSKIKPGKPQ